MSGIILKIGSSIMAVFGFLAGGSYKKSRPRAFLLGLALPLAFPPFFLLPVFYLAVTGLLTLLYRNDRSAKTHFILGWFFGFGFFISSLYWLGNVFQFFLHSFLLWPVAILLVGSLCGALALFPAFACWFAGRGRSFPARIFLWLAVFSLLEWVRGHIITGLPWNLAGLAWNISPPLMQVNAFLGIYGTSLLALASAAGLALLTVATPSVRRAGWGLFLAIPALCFMFGFGRILAISSEGEASQQTFFRIVQPNISQEIKWMQNLAEENFQQLLRVSIADFPPKTSMVLWPETATAWNLQDESTRDIRNHIARLLQRPMVVGSVRKEGANLYNSALVLDFSGNVTDYYDKAHLVPFGEYIPFRRIFPLLPRAITGFSDFTAGGGPRTVILPNGVKAGLLICYEAIFPGKVVEAQNRPDILINLSNDSWYGQTAGPYQHLELARIRAVEEGMGLLRVANTGISAAFDATGRKKGALGLGQAGALDVALPAPLPPTLYSQYGDEFFFWLLGLCAFLGLFFLRKTP